MWCIVLQQRAEPLDHGSGGLVRASVLSHWMQGNFKIGSIWKAKSLIKGSIWFSYFKNKRPDPDLFHIIFWSWIIPQNSLRYYSNPKSIPRNSDCHVNFLSGHCQRIVSALSPQSVDSVNALLSVFRLVLAITVVLMTTKGGFLTTPTILIILMSKY